MKGKIRMSEKKVQERQEYMNNNDLNILVEKAKNGDENAVNEIFELYSDVVENNVRWKVKNLSALELETEEMMQAGRLAVLEAIDSYNIATAVSFPTHLHFVVDKKLSKFVEDQLILKGISIK